MAYLKPTRYYRDIHSIDYNKLKEEGIKCLVFDLDNTLGLLVDRKCPEESKKLLKKLQDEGFCIYICSNNMKYRLTPYLKDLGVGGVSFSLKPSTRGLRKIKRNYKFLKKEMVIIGDQIITDILAGKRYKIKTILVDPLGKKEPKINFINRYLENIILNKYKSLGVFERGKYYE